MKFIFSLVIFYLFGSSHAFWSACPGTNLPTLDSMESPSCTDRCRVVRGEVFIGTLRMTFQRAHLELRARVTAFIFGIGINLPIDPPFDNQCNMIRFTNSTLAGCPTIPDTQYMILAEMTISNLYPLFTNTRVQVDYFEGNERVFCFEVVADLI